MLPHVLLIQKQRIMTEKEPKYIQGIGWRYATEHSMTRRMQDHDYQSRCIYMLTLTLADRSQPMLGRLTLDAQGNATLTPSELGKAVKAEWEVLAREYHQMHILRLQLMEEHLHVVIFVKERIPIHLGKLVGIVKNHCNKHYWAMLTAQGRLAPKGVETPPPLFAENFQDTILTHEGQLDTMLRYVDDNPKRAMTKRQNPELFKVVRQLNVTTTSLSRLSNLGSLTFAAIGNQWLLQRAVRMQVRCHNNTSPENLQLIARQKEYFLNRGKKGGVVVSPCISAGEREIARAALDAKQPLIVLLENGFPPLYKPPGKYFDACAEGLLLMLAPWPYHMEKRNITRQQCLALNDMAAAICNEPWTQDLEQALTKK